MYRVLLVEDEEIIRKGIRYSVPWEECGCSVVGEAENGAAGEEKIAELQPDNRHYRHYHAGKKRS